MRRPQEKLLSFEFNRVIMSGDRFCRQDYMLFKENNGTMFTFNPSILAINMGPVLLLAHLSQRLIGELIGYSWSGVRPSSGHR